MCASIAIQFNSGHFIQKQIESGRPFTQVANSILDDERLDEGAQNLLIKILRGRMDKSPTLNQLRKVMGRGKEWIRKRLRLLQKVGYIFVEYCRDRGNFSKLKIYASQRTIFSNSHATHGQKENSPLPHLGSPLQGSPLLRPIYKEIEDKESSYKKEQQQEPLILPIDKPVVIHKASEIDLTSTCDIVSHAAAFFDTAAEGEDMISAIQMPRAEPTDQSLMQMEEKRRLDEAHERALVINERLRGVIPFKDILRYIRRYGPGSVEAASLLMLDKDIFSKNSPGAFFASALKNDWAGSDPVSLIEKMEAREASKALKKSCESPVSQKKFTREDNITWWIALSDDQKIDAFEIANRKSSVIGFHFNSDDISVLDANLISRKIWLFGLLMEILGRE